MNKFSLQFINWEILKRYKSVAKFRNSKVYVDVSLRLIF